MLDARDLIGALTERGVQFYAGVPDSLLQSFCATLLAEIPAGRHIIAANEGSAVALATGWHLATGSTPCVYMQNSGLGNAVNPLLSLVDPEVYGIPLLMIVGWRGEILQGVQLRDEPQHVKQGRITLDLLDAMAIPNRVIDSSTADLKGAIHHLLDVAREQSRATALVVRRDAFAPVTAESLDVPYTLSREQALEIFIEELPADSVFVATTGKLSRELYELRRRKKRGAPVDFLTVGSMGHALQIACGIAAAKPACRVVALDGDGALIMHMGGMTTSATMPNLIHVVINNGSHESVGSQPTSGFRIDMQSIARGCGYKSIYRAESAEDVRRAIGLGLQSLGAAFLEVRTRPGARPDLGRPKETPSEIKAAFMRTLEKPQPRR